MYQYLFRNGFVIDGTGAPARIVDVAVSEGRIMEVAPEIKADTGCEIDAVGKILCPGFIDVHSHSDITFLYENNPGSKIYQGITTEVTGNCGFSPFPLRRESRWLEQRRASLSFIDVEGRPWNWETYGQYRENINAAQPNVNLAVLVGHGSIRAMVMGYENKKATPVQLQAMCSILEEHLKQGVAGISTGLGYPPDFYGDEEELTALAEVIKAYERIFAFHIRGERATLFRAVDEVITVGKKSGAKVHISHLKCAGVHNAGRSKELLVQIERAVSSGVDVTFDMYPYTAGSSYLSLVFPPVYHEGGIHTLLKRLEDPEKKREIIRRMEQGTEGWSTLIGEQQGQNLMITSVKKNKDCIGKRISEIAKFWNCSPSEVACRLMLEEEGRAEMVMFLAEQEDVDRIAMHERCYYGTDGLAMGGDKPLIRQMPHPRYYGSFPVLLKRYGKSGKIGMEELIHRMTGAAAVRFGIRERGLIQPGYYADCIVFDPDKMNSSAVYENPCVFSEGIEYLMVNGCLEIEHGKLSGRTGGRILD